ncbi:MAG TPA: hypothetical protein VF278_21615 [Pirellulales bacterium]
MATSEQSGAYGTRPAAVGSLASLLWEGRPLIGLAATLFTAIGHTMNFREMAVAHGWVPAVFYILQSAYLAAVAMALLAAPTLGHHLSSYAATQLGFVLAIAGSFLNGLAIWAPFPIFVIGRSIAGAGAGLVIYFTPFLLKDRYRPALSWVMILSPVAGPGVIAAFTMSHGVSDWEWGFLWEGISAVGGFLLLWPLPPTVQSSPKPPRGSPAYLAPLALSCVPLIYLMHWGQLQGWLESPDIVWSSFAVAVAWAVALWLAWPHIDFPVLRENWTRLAVYCFGGICQFFHALTMNVYGGSIVNFSSWQRAWLIWPMPIGIGVALAMPHLPWRRPWKLGWPGAVVGLLLLAAGLYLGLDQTKDWPFWQILNTPDLNWFAAPTHWELAPGRFLMGLGVGLFMLAVATLTSPDVRREAEVRPFFSIAQFVGATLGTGLFVNFLLIGQLVHYSYSADRGFIQPDELARRHAVLRDEFRRQGEVNPDRAAEVLLYRFVRYEAENMIYATIYGVFLVASLVLAGLCLVFWIWPRPMPVGLLSPAPEVRRL